MTTESGILTGLKPPDDPTAPNPVPYITMNDPRDTAFDGAFSVLSWFTMAA
jgi:hypothetical protein